MLLKDFFSPVVVRAIAGDISAVHPAFDGRAFEREALRGLDRLELLARGGHICDAMARHLPESFPDAAAIIVRSLGPRLPSGQGNGMAPFKYLPHVLYVQRYGLEHFDAAIEAQYELTKRFSCESSIRPYLERYPRETYAVLERWAGDDDMHVRRLVSEGTRPRLPWAARLRSFQEDPAPVLALLERLKDDPELYVRRSVANNLNDIGVDHPDVLVQVCRRWMRGASADRQWVVRHGLRSLVKKGHPGALAALGVRTGARVDVTRVRLSKPRVSIGDTVQFSVELASRAAAAQDLIVDYAVHFVKANGTTSPKVFKLKRLTLARKAAVTLNGRVSFRQMSTRTCRPGRHRIDLLVNGAAYPLGAVHVTD